MEVATYDDISPRRIGVGRMLRSILDDWTSRLGHHAVISLIAEATLSEFT